MIEISKALEDQRNHTVKIHRFEYILYRLGGIESKHFIKDPVDGYIARFYIACENAGFNFEQMIMIVQGDYLVKKSKEDILEEFLNNVSNDEYEAIQEYIRLTKEES